MCKHVVQHSQVPGRVMQMRGSNVYGHPPDSRRVLALEYVRPIRCSSKRPSAVVPCVLVIEGFWERLARRHITCPMLSVSADAMRLSMTEKHTYMHAAPGIWH